MTGSVRRLWRDLLGRGDALFIDMLVRQVEVALRATHVMREAHVRGEAGPELVATVEELEDQGDDLRRLLLDELARALSTPIDREDLFELSRALDDVVDNLRDFAVETQRYGVGPNRRCIPLLEALGQGLEKLKLAIEKLYEGAAGVPAASRSAKRAHGTRNAYHDAMSDLLHEELTIDTMRQRELLRRLDVTGLRLDEAADALTFGALKRS